MRATKRDILKIAELFGYARYARVPLLKSLGTALGPDRPATAEREREILSLLILSLDTLSLDTLSLLILSLLILSLDTLS